MFACGAGFYIYMRPTFDLNQNPLVHHNVESKHISDSWRDYLNDCGGENVIENFVHTKMVFNEKYENNIVRWSGFFAEVKEKQKSFFGMNNKHHLSILVKMEPSESAVFADLVLSVSSENYEKNKEVYDSLKKGQGIDFEATLISLGNEFKMHHLHVKKLSINENFHNSMSEIIVRESSLP